MGIIKGFKDMGAMLNAAPDLIESANQLAANAQAQVQAAAQAQTAAEPSAAVLAAIGGVDLAAYVQVSKGIAAYAYDATKLPLVAASYGISAENWALAQDGWAARIQSDPAVGATFNQLYTAA